jgi:hypothetical protein
LYKLCSPTHITAFAGAGCCEINRFKLAWSLQQQLLARRAMRLMAWMLLLTFVAAQPTGARRRVFVSPDGVFRFSYTSDFLPNTEENKDEVKNSYIPVCDDGTVCVISRRDYFAGTNFQAWVSRT